MDECDFQRLAQNTKEILAYLTEKSEIATVELENCIDEISAVYKKYYDKGLEPRHISHVLLDTASATMLAASDLGQAAIFAEHVRDSGKRDCRIISRHWPPVDRKNWPFDPKQWPVG